MQQINFKSKHCKLFYAKDELIKNVNYFRWPARFTGDLSARLIAHRENPDDRFYYYAFTILRSEQNRLADMIGTLTFDGGDYT